MWPLKKYFLMILIADLIPNVANAPVPPQNCQ